MVHAVGELATKVNRAPIAKSIVGVSAIEKKLFVAEPDAIVWPSGSPPRVTRWISTVSGPADGHVMLLMPTPASVPCAPTVTTCAIFRPPAPPNNTDGCVVPPACCSRTSTRSVSARVAVCGSSPAGQLDAEQSTTCTTNGNDPVFVGTPLNEPLEFSAMPGGSDPDRTLNARVPTPPLADRLFP